MAIPTRIPRRSRTDSEPNRGNVSDPIPFAIAKGSQYPYPNPMEQAPCRTRSARLPSKIFRNFAKLGAKLESEHQPQTARARQENGHDPNKKSTTNPMPKPDTTTNPPDRNPSPSRPEPANIRPWQPPDDDDPAHRRR